MFPDVDNPTNTCTHMANIQVMFRYYIQAVHQKPTKKEEKEVILTSKKQKRMKSKPPKFLDFKTKDKFRKKLAEFQAYKVRAEIEGEEVTHNLFRACKTPLRRKLVDSSRVEKVVSKMSPETLMDELQRI